MSERLQFLNQSLAERAPQLQERRQLALALGISRPYRAPNTETYEQYLANHQRDGMDWLVGPADGPEEWAAQRQLSEMLDEYGELGLLIDDLKRAANDPASTAVIGNSPMAHNVRVRELERLRRAAEQAAKDADENMW